MLTYTIPTTMDRDRLLALADYLDTKVKDECFDIDCYQSAICDEKFEAELVAQHCGTTACAIGYMPLVDPDNWAYVNKKTLPVCIHCSSTGLRSASNYFGLGYSGLEGYLFMPGVGYETRQDVVARIRDLCSREAGETISLV